MASGDGDPPSLLGKPPIFAPSPLLPSATPNLSNHVAPPPRSWAKIVDPRRPPPSAPSLADQKIHFEKLRNSIQDFVSLDPYFLSRMQDRMQNTLYAKFFGKALPLDLLRSLIQDAWKDLGSVSVADLPNGYFFLSCDSPEMQAAVLSGGPWTFGGMVLKLFPCRPNFQPAFERLSTAAVWLQLHHLPMELWHSEILEEVAGQLGRVLKIDDLTLSSTRARFARVCVEMDIDKPLKQGFWVGFGSREAFITILYESLPVFCFKCGLVGHAASSCPVLGCSPSTREDQSPVVAPAKQDGLDTPMLVDGASELVSSPPDSSRDQISPPGSSSLDPVPEDNFGPWMVVQHRRKRGGGSSSSGLHRSRPPSRDPNATWNHDALHARHVPPLRVPQVSSYRGGRGGRGGRGFSPRDFPPFRDSFHSGASPYPEAEGGSSSSLLEPDSVRVVDSFEREHDPFVPFPLKNAPAPHPPSDSLLTKGKASDLSPSLPLSSPLTHKSPLLPKIPPAPLSPLSQIPPAPPSPLESSLMVPPALLLSSSPLSPFHQENPQLGMKADGSSDCSDSHLALVQKVASALCPPLSLSAPLEAGKDKLDIEEEVMAESDSSGEIESDSTLFNYQQEIKASSKKESRRSKTSRKLGRHSDPY